MTEYQADEIDRVIGHFIPVDDNAIVRVIDGPTVDEDGREHITRINGYCECPKCDVRWPFEEKSTAWEQQPDGTWKTIEFDMGVAFCFECNLAMVDTFDGVACLEL